MFCSNVMSHSCLSFTISNLQACKSKVGFYLLYIKSFMRQVKKTSIVTNNASHPEHTSYAIMLSIMLSFVEIM